MLHKRLLPCEFLTVYCSLQQANVSCVSMQFSALNALISLWLQVYINILPIEMCCVALPTLRLNVLTFLKPFGCHLPNEIIF